MTAITMMTTTMMTMMMMITTTTKNYITHTYSLICLQKNLNSHIEKFLCYDLHKMATNTKLPTIKYHIISTRIYTIPHVLLMKRTQEIKLKICSNSVEDDDHCILGHSTVQIGTHVYSIMLQETAITELTAIRTLNLIV